MWGPRKLRSSSTDESQTLKVAPAPPATNTPRSSLSAGIATTTLPDPVIRADNPARVITRVGAAPPFTSLP